MKFRKNIGNKIQNGNNLINYKYYNNNDMNDDVFLEKNLIILQKYLSS